LDVQVASGPTALAYGENCNQKCQTSNSQ
jgi:hypothetical protein